MKRFDELSEDEQDEFKATAQSLYVCSICGQYKTHYRLYGYRCHNLEHEEREHELRLADLRKKFGDRSRGMGKNND